MKNAFDLRDGFRSTLNTFDGHTKISQIDFAAHFRKTDERVVFTFDGWDGKSYDGETRRARVLRCDIDGFTKTQFIKVGMGVHAIIEGSSVIEKATGEAHPTVFWVIDVARA